MHLFKKGLYSCRCYFLNEQIGNKLLVFICGIKLLKICAVDFKSILVINRILTQFAVSFYSVYFENLLSSFCFKSGE